MNISPQALKELVSQFNDQSLPKTNWTHEAHLLMGLWHVREFSYEDALCRLRAGIIQLNIAHGTVNNAHSGYHETLTVFWVKTLSLYNSLYPFESMKEQAEHMLTTRIAHRTFPFEFYDREKLLSPEYRSRYMPEELKQLNREAITSI